MKRPWLLRRFFGEVRSACWPGVVNYYLIRVVQTKLICSRLGVSDLTVLVQIGLRRFLRSENLPSGNLLDQYQRRKFLCCSQRKRVGGAPHRALSETGVRHAMCLVATCAGASDYVD